MHLTHELTTPRVVFGRGSLAQAPAEAARLAGERVLLIGNPLRGGVAQTLVGALGPRVVGVVDQVRQHVPVETAQLAAQRASSVAADLLMAVGGGSAIGTAKAVARRTGLPILAIPTTFSGSEMTSIWGETEGRVKVTGRDPGVLPRTVVYDPDLSASMPAQLTATSGMNALAHCAEAVYDPDCSPLIRAAALEGARALARGLRKTGDATDSTSASEHMLYGAWLAGVALGGASMGLHHELCHVLGGQQRLAHGALHSVLLPYVLAHEEPAAAAVLGRFAAAVQHRGNAARAVWDLGRRLGTPASLVEIGFRTSGTQDVIDAVLSARRARPRPVSPVALRHLLQCAALGLPPHDSTQNKGDMS
jgi:maleylacetate reductase